MATEQRRLVNFEITLLRTLDQTFVAEVRALPGVLVADGDAQAAVRRVAVLALHVVAERIESGERDPTDVSVSFSLNILNGRSRLLMGEDEARRQIVEAVSSDVLEQVATAILDPVQNAGGGVPGVIAEALGRSRPQARRAGHVLARLESAGWKEHRRAPSHRTLRNHQGAELVFPFRDDDVLRNELLDRFSTLGGVTF